MMSKMTHLSEAREGRDAGGQNRQSESTGACRAYDHILRIYASQR